MRNKTLAIDFDGTICKKQSYGDGTINSIPNENAQETLTRLREMGYELIIFTTRLNPNFEGDIEWKRKQITDWLELHDIPYDDLTNQKPAAISYIDDRAVRFTNWNDIGNYYLD